MGNYTREEILQMAEEEDVEFIRLQFTDMFGTLKNIAITARELPRALDNRCIVDGSFIAGIAGESEPDMYLRPDLTLLQSFRGDHSREKLPDCYATSIVRTEPLMREVRDIS